MDLGGGTRFLATVGESIDRYDFSKKKLAVHFQNAYILWPQIVLLGTYLRETTGHACKMYTCSSTFIITVEMKKAQMFNSRGLVK